jgi:hypothetical protein
MPRPVAILALVPGFRLVAILVLLGILPQIDGLWLLYMISIPGTFVWLILLGAWPPAPVRIATATPLAPQPSL